MTEADITEFLAYNLTRHGYEVKRLLMQLKQCPSQSVQAPVDGIGCHDARQIRNRSV